MESPRLSFLLQKCLEQMRSLHRHDADRKGFGHSPTSILNLDLKNTIQKLQVGTNLPCLPCYFRCAVFLYSNGNNPVLLRNNSANRLEVE